MFRVCIDVVLLCLPLLLNISPSYGNPAEKTDSKIYFPSDDTKYENSECDTSSGSKGVCLKLQDCIHKGQKYETSDVCSFDKNEAIYCCPVDLISETDVRFGESNGTDSQPAVEASKIDTSITTRAAAQICKRHYPVEGVDDEKKNITEQNAVSKMAQSYSYLTSIGWTNKKGKIDWKCLGVFVSETVILSDAQCVSSKTDPPNRARVIIPDQEKSFRKIIYNINSTHIHPDFKSPELYHNLAILKIPSDTPKSKLAKPACLWLSDDMPSNLVRIGYTDSDMKQAHERNVSLISATECSLDHEKTTSLPKSLTTDLICTFLKDRCQRGSEGGVLLDKTKELNKTPYIAGVGSFGSYCKNLVPSVYTRLFPYMDWIEIFLT